MQHIVPYFFKYFENIFKCQIFNSLPLAEANGLEGKNR